MSEGALIQKVQSMNLRGVNNFQWWEKRYHKQLWSHWKKNEIAIKIISGRDIVGKLILVIKFLADACTNSLLIVWWLFYCFINLIAHAFNRCGGSRCELNSFTFFFSRKIVWRVFLEVVHKNLGVVSTIFSPVKGSENRPQEGGHHTLKDSLKLRVEGAAKIVFQKTLIKTKTRNFINSFLIHLIQIL